MQSPVPGMGRKADRPGPCSGRAYILVGRETVDKPINTNISAVKTASG